MDTKDQITPEGCSKTVGIIIGVFITIFSIALIVCLVFFN